MRSNFHLHSFVIVLMLLRMRLARCCSSMIVIEWTFSFSFTYINALRGYLLTDEKAAGQALREAQQQQNSEDAPVVA